MNNNDTRTITEIFADFFAKYQHVKFKGAIKYVVTSTDRKGGPTNPHALPGNAMDITLRKNGDYAGIHEYNYLFAYLMEAWPYRAGIDNTTGNIHIHLDLGRTNMTVKPYFFKEDNGKFLHQLTKKEEIA